MQSTVVESGGGPAGGGSGDSGEGVAGATTTVTTTLSATTESGVSVTPAAGCSSAAALPPKPLSSDRRSDVKSEMSEVSMKSEDVSMRVAQPIPQSMTNSCDRKLGRPCSFPSSFANSDELRETILREFEMFTVLLCQIWIESGAPRAQVSDTHARVMRTLRDIAETHEKGAASSRMRQMLVDQTFTDKCTQLKTEALSQFREYLESTELYCVCGCQTSSLNLSSKQSNIISDDSKSSASSQSLMDDDNVIDSSSSMTSAMSDLIHRHAQMKVRSLEKEIANLERERQEWLRYSTAEGRRAMKTERENKLSRIINDVTRCISTPVIPRRHSSSPIPYHNHTPMPPRSGLFNSGVSRQSDVDEVSPLDPNEQGVTSNQTNRSSNFIATDVLMTGQTPKSLADTPKVLINSSSKKRTFSEMNDNGDDEEDVMIVDLTSSMNQTTDEEDGNREMSLSFTENSLSNRHANHDAAPDYAKKQPIRARPSELDAELDHRADLLFPSLSSSEQVPRPLSRSDSSMTQSRSAVAIHVSNSGNESNNRKMRRKRAPMKKARIPARSASTMRSSRRKSSRRTGVSALKKESSVNGNNERVFVIQWSQMEDFDDEVELICAESALSESERAKLPLTHELDKITFSTFPQARPTHNYLVLKRTLANSFFHFLFRCHWKNLFVERELSKQLWWSQYLPKHPAFLENETTPFLTQNSSVISNLSKGTSTVDLMNPSNLLCSSKYDCVISFQVVFRHIERLPKQVNLYLRRGVMFSEAKLVSLLRECFKNDMPPGNEDPLDKPPGFALGGFRFADFILPRLVEPPSAVYPKGSGFDSDADSAQSAVSMSSSDHNYMKNNLNSCGDSLINSPSLRGTDIVAMAVENCKCKESSKHKFIDIYVSADREYFRFKREQNPNVMLPLVEWVVRIPVNRRGELFPCGCTDYTWQYDGGMTLYTVDQIRHDLIGVLMRQVLGKPYVDKHQLYFDNVECTYSLDFGRWQEDLVKPWNWHRVKKKGVESPDLIQRFVQSKQAKTLAIAVILKREHCERYCRRLLDREIIRCDLVN